MRFLKNRARYCTETHSETHYETTLVICTLAYDCPDPNDNHVGVNVGGSPVSLASATAPLILNDAQTKHAWIHYDPTSGGTLRVFLSSDPVQPLTPTLTAS
ncbi:hypothetical protein CLOM_g14359 [Closterium sp. NIES-68]|nr:hypothetical protein CLOM_g14359 [Closterium sp. NIES-68]